jgi:RecJ-like exonuclease
MARSRRQIQSTEKTKDKVVSKANPQQGTGVRCALCGGQTRVTHSIAIPEISVQGRYRKCDVCGAKIYTEESLVRVIQQKG